MAKDLLNHGKLSKEVEIKIQDVVERQDVVGDEQEITKVQNIRVDNHIRNKILAFGDVGRERITRDLVARWVRQEEETLTPEEMEEYQKSVQDLERKDWLKERNKQQKRKLVAKKEK